VARSVVRFPGKTVRVLITILGNLRTVEHPAVMGPANGGARESRSERTVCDFAPDEVLARGVVEPRARVQVLKPSVDRGYGKDPASFWGLATSRRMKVGIWNSFGVLRSRDRIR